MISQQPFIIAPCLLPKPTMCIIWTRKYILCGCIWDIKSEICPKNHFCWSPRMIQLQDSLHTCKECWLRGDKRITEGDVIENANRKGQGQENDKSGHEISSNIDANDNRAGQIETNSGNADDESESSSAPSSRPQTPTLNFEPDSSPDIDSVPEFLLAAEYNYDLSRVCDPVNLASIRRNYRARRGRTDWYLLEGKHAAVLLFFVLFSFSLFCLLIRWY